MEMKIAVVDMGGQFNHLIYRAIVDLGEEAEMVPMDITTKELREKKVDGVIMGGGPQRVGSEMGKLGNTPKLLRELNVPVLTMCVTHQLLATVYGGKAGPASQPEFGVIEIEVDEEREILKGMGPRFRSIESHNDEVTVLPPVFDVLASSKKCRVQVIQHREKPIFGVQFHPETMQGEKDMQLFRNFVRICRKHRKK
jgi:GMP synthase (glutamine-hydrolysing)